MYREIRKTTEKYTKNLDIVTLFGTFILLTLLLMPIVSSFTSVGTGFIRFTSIYADMTLAELLLLFSVSIISIALISIFLSGLISIVKLQETLDHVTYSKVMSTFKKYVTKIFLYLTIVTALSIAVGTTMTYLNAPADLIHIAILIIWLLFIFTPQVAVIENFGVLGSMKDALKFIRMYPIALVGYIGLGVIMMVILVFLEALLGQYFIWEHKLVSLILVSLIVLPILQIFATELYLKRYPLSGL